MQFVHDRRFADTGIAGYEHHLGGTLRHNAIERRKQHIDFALSPVQLLRYQQPVRRVVRAQSKWFDAITRAPFRQAPPKIGFEARCGLVALLGIFGEKPHDDGGQRFRYRATVRRRYRLTRDVAVNPLQRVGGGKREHAREQLVQSDAQRVEIAARIHRTVHAPGLLGRHVGKCAGYDFRRRGRRALAGKPGREAKSGEPHATGIVDKRICRLHVLMNDASPVSLAERRRETDGNAQETGEIDRVFVATFNYSFEWFPAGIL
jgi:hypothetical protein